MSGQTLYDKLWQSHLVEQREDGSIAISQVIFVQRDTQKAIVLGKGGQMIKRSGIAAERHPGYDVRPDDADPEGVAQGGVFVERLQRSFRDRAADPGCAAGAATLGFDLQPLRG